METLNKLPQYILDWTTIVKSMRNVNTYKLALGRAILECVYQKSDLEENKDLIIQITDLAKCVLKYYWNQGFFFNIKQGSTKPIICTYVEQLIDSYTIKNGSYPKWWYEACGFFSQKILGEYYKKISRALIDNPIPRFLYVDKGTIPVYSYNKKEIIITYENAILIKEYNTILLDVLNFKWAKLLEQFNKLTPQIALKISQIADQSIERQNENLTKIRKLFLSLSDGNNLLDFYTDQELDISNISIDHFIPWSFIYSDDIWNLVPTSKSYNSSKSNKLPKEELIIKLNERNKKLLSILKLNPKYKDLVYDLENAICNNLVKEYYYICKM